jgi:hypothetical protein
MSNKRILPAFILAATVGFLGLHRFYAGRHLTALLQLALFIPGAVMLRHQFAGLQALQTIDDVQEWVLNHPLQPLPWLLVGIPSFWALIDCYSLIARRFRDGAGNKMTRWV